ncbi:glycosyltransferase family 9 protein [Candidatus Pacearchaeota archaeon]|nr:glycosyltransferase family 9 protein [Candidatus Pacearchaeota archaeon]
MKIAIIKLGALGDVVRTLSVLPAIKEKYPNSEIFWITKQNALQIFENNPYIEKVFAAPYKINSKEKFDILYNFDIEDEATKLALKIKAEKKFGFYSQEGFPASFNLAGEYYLNTLFDDNLKKNNKKTYQEIMFEVAELKWEKQICPVFFNNKDKEYAEKFFKENNLISKKIIGIHMGAGSRWPSKAWAPEKVQEFISKAKQKGYEILLFGGPEELEKIEQVMTYLKKQNIKILINNPKNTLKEFASLVNLCKIMVCSDSLALHLSLALRKPTIGLFFCTSPNEVEDYNLLKKIVSPMLKDFFPEKMDEYNKKLVNSISADDVLFAVNSIK